MFANLNQGSLIHIFSIDEVEYYTGTIESVSYNYNGLQNIGSFLTLKVNMNGKSISIEGVSANTSVSKTSNYIVTDNKEAMVNQIEVLAQNDKKIIENIERYKNNIIKYEEILNKISPTHAKESDRDKAIINLNNRVDNLDNKLDKILTTLTANNKEK